MKRPVTLALVALTLSAAFAVQVPTAGAIVWRCFTSRDCRHGQVCHRVDHHRRGVCERPDSARSPEPVGTPAPPSSGGPTSHGPEIMCPMIYQPVCGADGKTYPNACHAKRAGARVSHTGSC